MGVLLISSAIYYHKYWWCGCVWLLSENQEKNGAGDNYHKPLALAKKKGVPLLVLYFQTNSYIMVGSAIPFGLGRVICHKLPRWWFPFRSLRPDVWWRFMWHNKPSHKNQPFWGAYISTINIHKPQLGRSSWHWLSTQKVDGGQLKKGLWPSCKWDNPLRYP
jgi:hypothetical protein